MRNKECRWSSSDFSTELQALAPVAAVKFSVLCALEEYEMAGSCLTLPFAKWAEVWLAGNRSTSHLAEGAIIGFQLHDNKAPCMLLALEAGGLLGRSPVVASGFSHMSLGELEKRGDIKKARVLELLLEAAKATANETASTPPAVKKSTRRKKKQPPVDIVCEKCGSADVRRDALAAWNTEKQEWELSSVQDQGYCESCGDEADLIETPLEKG